MISIVIPAYNEENYISQCLESLKSQDYPGEYEIIVVDNASTDKTAEVAEESGAKVIFCPEKGVFYARQAGAEAASGEIIIQADADTIYPEDWLARIDRHFATHPNSIALAGEYRYKNPMKWAKVEYFSRFILNIAGFILVARPVSISGANFAFRRDAFFKTNGYDPGAIYPDQWGISRDLSRVGKIDLDRKLLVYTSTRRIQKGFFFIFVDVWKNSFKMVIHYFKHIFIPANKTGNRIPGKKRSSKEVILRL
jgi:peptidoglycan-N-acetylglucosamine deacetylase